MMKARNLFSVNTPILVLIGFTATIGQVVLLRELLVISYGNELSLGIALASWLIWSALGSHYLGPRTFAGLDPRRLMASLQTVVSVTFPVTIVAIRSSKAALQALPGELIGPGAVLLISFLSLSLFCFLSGCLFAAGCRLKASAEELATGSASGSVYLLDAIGSGIGGLVASLVLIRYLSPDAISLVVSLLNLAAAAILTFRSRAGLTSALLAVACATSLLPAAAGKIESYSLGLLWRDYELREVRNSIYGNLVVADAGTVRTLFANGLALFSAPDVQKAEETVHLALLEHPKPEVVLLLGPGMNGSLLEALKHPQVERIDLVELDPAILELASRHFSEWWSPAVADPRVSVHHIDGRLFVKQGSEGYDVIIVSVPDPHTAQLNRFYTVEFFREIRQRLNPSGVLSVQVTGAENYLSDELLDFLRCLRQTLEVVFENVKAIPGGTIHIFASGSSGTITLDASVLLERLKERRLETEYITDYYLPHRLMADRVDDLNLRMSPLPSTPVNRDFSPVAYYFDLVLWTAQFDAFYRDLFYALRSISFWLVLSLVLAVSIAAAVAGTRVGPRVPPVLFGTGYAVGVMGGTLLGFQVITILGFQSIYGYVYYQLSLLVAAFMVGLAAGSAISIREAGKTGEVHQLGRLALLQVIAACAAIFLYASLLSLSRLAYTPMLSNLTAWFFPLLALLSGLLGGYQFPLASRVYFSHARPEQHRPGVLYGLDLLGACAAGLLLSVYLLPVFGILKSALILAAANGGPTVALLLARKRLETGAPDSPNP